MITKNQRNSIITWGVAALSLTLLIGSHLVEEADAQSVLRPNMVSGAIGPRHPLNIVNQTDFINGSIGHSDNVIYTVPWNKYLIITDLAVNANGAPPFNQVSVQLRDGNGVLKLDMMFLGNDLEWLDNGYFGTEWQPEAFHSSIGLVFEPGTDVRMTEHSGSNWIYYNMVGYLY